MSLTRTDNPIHDSHGIFNFSKRALQGLKSKNTERNIHCDNFELGRSLLDYLVFVGSVNLGSFVLSIYKNRVWVLLES